MSFITPSIVVTADIVKVEAVPPRARFPQGTLPSVGSKLHVSRQCRPCAHSWKPGGCFKGKDCEFCHTCNEKDFRRYQRLKIANRNKLNTRKPWWQAPQEPEWKASWLGSSMASSSGDSDLVPTPGFATCPSLLCESEPPLPPLEVDTMFQTMTQPCRDTEKVHAAGPACLRIKNTFLDLDDLGKEDVVDVGDPKHKRSSSCPAVLQQVDESVEGLPAHSTAWIPLHRSLATWSSEEVPDAHCSDIVWCHPNGAAAAAEEQWLSEIVSMPM